MTLCCRLFFSFYFFTYVLSVTGNLNITILNIVDSHLKTPMYFLLQNFSVLEVSFTTVYIFQGSWWACYKRQNY